MVHPAYLIDEVLGRHLLAFGLDPLNHRHRALAAVRSQLLARLGCRFDVYRPIASLRVLGDENARHIARVQLGDETVLHVIHDLRRIALQRITIAAAAVVGVAENVARHMR